MRLERTARQHDTAASRRVEGARQPVDMSRYFRGGVDDLADTPWRQHDEHIALDPGTWSHMPVEDVPTDNLHHTQRKVLKKHLTTHRDPNAEAEGGDHPWVVDTGTEHWVIDGHHRAVTSIDRGEPTFRAHVMRPNFSYNKSPNP